MTAWTLGLDFGTTYTVGAVADRSGRTVVDVEGDGSCRMSSAVLLNEDGTFTVGRAAVHQSLFRPDRFEATPKRLVGEPDMLLGGDVVSVTDAVAAVLRRVGEEAIRAAGGTPPARVVLTHPADWGSTRTGVLLEAAARAGLPGSELVPEPVAAAVHIGAAGVATGRFVAVYDFGGGTFDAAVLLRTEDGFEVAGPPGGRDPLGGEYIDSQIIQYLGQGPLGEHPDWPKLVDPPDPQWRRDAAELRSEVRKAKEGLSNQTVWQLWVPGIERDVQLGRDELEDLIRDDVAATVEILLETVRGAGAEPKDLAGVYLVGGSSRIPMVAAEVWAKTGVKPSVQSDPKTVVALGATAWWRSQPATEARPPERVYSSRLAMATRTVFWSSPVFCYGYLTVTDPQGNPLTLSDEPAPGPLEQIDAAALARWEAEDGSEVVRDGEVEWLGAQARERTVVRSQPPSGLPAGQWVERYAVIRDRAVTALAPASIADRVDAVQKVRSYLDPTRLWQMGVTAGVADGDGVYERLELIRGRTGHRVTAESFDVTAGWAERRVEAFRQHPDYTPLGQAQVRLLGSAQRTWGLGLTDGVPGQMHTFWQSRAGAGPQQTRVWVGQAGGRGYSVVATLPESEKLGFRLLLAHVTLVAG